VWTGFKSVNPVFTVHTRSDLEYCCLVGKSYCDDDECQAFFCSEMRSSDEYVSYKIQYNLFLKVHYNTEYTF